MHLVPVPMEFDLVDVGAPVEAEHELDHVPEATQWWRLVERGRVHAGTPRLAARVDGEGEAQDVHGSRPLQSSGPSPSGAS